MSKTIDYRLITRPHLCDIVKADWAADKLPDDSVPLPETVSPPPEDNDDLHEETEALEKQSNKWNDLGLSQLQS
eukprot:jgi/Ulvmu1/6647/UM003_0285.1